MEKIRILYFVDRMRTGGIQILLINLLKSFDKEKYCFDLLLLDDGNDYPMERKIEDVGAIIYKLKGVWVDSPFDYIPYKKAVNNFFAEHHNYDVVHMHSSSKNYLILKCAQKYGIPIRIAHSHNTGFQTHNAVKIFIGNLMKKQLIQCSTHYLACSEIAGKWLFGEKLVAKGRVMVIKNGIELEKYKYNDLIRKIKRDELGIKNQIVIGNVGRFVPQKNHIFLLEIFAEILRLRPDTLLLLAGVGETMIDMKAKADKLGISDNIKFLGFRMDIYELMQAMDIFLMPSLYEGFPVTAVEAQAAGLPCVLSDTITKEAALLDDTIYIDLNKDAKYWAAQTINLIRNTDRENSYTVLKAKGFDIKDMSESLGRIYIGED